MNSRPILYERIALPLSYSGVNILYHAKQKSAMSLSNSGFKYLKSRDGPKNANNFSFNVLFVQWSEIS